MLLNTQTVQHVMMYVPYKYTKSTQDTLTKVTSEMLDKLDPFPIRLFPELDVAINAGRHQKAVSGNTHVLWTVTVSVCVKHQITVTVSSGLSLLLC